MTDVIRWLVAAEVLTVIGLPLTVWTFRSLPDVGFAFAKVLALVLATWVMWWLGSLVNLGGNLVLLWLVVAGGGVASWLLLGRTAIASLKTARQVFVIEEILFALAFLVWCLVRSLHPDIFSGLPTTERPMDLMLLQTSGTSAHYPPQDLWLAGRGVNYYYFGYLVMATLGRATGTSVFVTYNLALALIFAIAVAGTYSLAFNLTRSRVWSLLAPLFVVLMGNAHGLFVQVLNGHFPWNQGFWFWESTRVVGEFAPGAAYTINEFPLFSLILGDLHPHVLAIPIVLLALGCALALMLEVAGRAPIRATLGRIAIVAVIIGSLFATNSWDFPTYLAIAMAAILAGVGLASIPSGHADRGSAESGTNGSRPISYQRAIQLAATLAGASILAFLPFYLQYHSPVQGIGRVTTPTDVGQFLQVFGFAGFVAVSFMAVIAWRQGATIPILNALASRQGGAPKSLALRLSDYVVPLTFLVVVGVAAFLDLWVLFGSLTVAAGAILLLLSPNQDSEPDYPDSIAENGRAAGLTDRLRQGDIFVLVLIALAALVIAGTELLYLRDSFDGSGYYRMNTVFKLYYQVWIVLGVASAYAAYRVTTLIRGRSRSALAAWVLVLVAGSAFGAVYTVLGPLSYFGVPNGGQIALQPHNLNGLEMLSTSDPQDYQAIRWLRAHITGRPTLLEATGGDFSLFGRVSTYTGLPSLLGWQGHETQWRGSDPLLAARHALIDRIYSTNDISLARNLLFQSGVRLVYVGPCERQVYANGLPLCGGASPVASARNALRKFARFMTVVYDRDGVEIFRVPG
ncbi:MAG TPA: DUF2298 domain-containing protein [Chloroflexota bacterium]|nr:DUF2298 domain-containing protein [Chloroflexota bacterium]